MLPTPWTVIQSTDVEVFPVFVNSTPVSVTITLTFQAEPANALPWIVYQYVPSHTLGTFPYGEAIVEVVPGQTVTTVFDVPSRASCFWVYAYPAFLRYAAHSAGGYWARISRQASEMAS